MTTRFDEQHDETSKAILHALETAPAVTVPEDFASRVMARIPQTPRKATAIHRARALNPRYGRTVTLIGLGVLLIAMLFVTRTTGVPALTAALQLLLLVQICAYAVWLGVTSWHRG